MITSRISFLPMLALTLISAWAQAPLPAPEVRVSQLLQKFADSGDAGLLTEAREALRGLPAETLKMNKVRFLQGRLALYSGDFVKALEIGRALNKDIPDELDPYGLICDAARALGKNDEAEKAAQWMLNLRPEDVRGLQRAAALREDLGDLNGAEEFLLDAYKRVPKNEVSLRASLLTQMAGVQMKKDRVADARKLLAEAIRLVPGYHAAELLMKRIGNS